MPGIGLVLEYCLLNIKCRLAVLMLISILVLRSCSRELERKQQKKSAQHCGSSIVWSRIMHVMSLTCYIFYLFTLQLQQEKTVVDIDFIFFKVPTETYYANMLVLWNARKSNTHDGVSSCSSSRFNASMLNKTFGIIQENGQIDSLKLQNGLALLGIPERGWISVYWIADLKIEL